MANLECRQAMPADVDELIAIADHFALPNINDDRLHGYLSNSITREAMSNLIAMENVVVGVFQSRTVGYYLVDHYGLTYSDERQRYFTEKRAQALLTLGLSSMSVSFGAQCAIDVTCQGMGFRTAMLKCLLHALRGRFDYLFGKIRIDNPRALAGHQKDGWITAVWDDAEVFAVLPTFVTLPQTSAASASH